MSRQVDQAVFKELVAEKLPLLAEHLDTHGVDPALFSLNWFLCLFVDTLPVNTYLHIWDAFLFEGSKVIHRSYISVSAIINQPPCKYIIYINLKLWLALW